VDAIGQEAFGVVIDEGSNVVKAFQDFGGGACVDHRLSNTLSNVVEKSHDGEIAKKVRAHALSTCSMYL
jgi:hypothetical protein